jgi:hypothetical protein
MAKQKLNTDEGATIELSSAIEVSGAIIKTVFMRAPTVGDNLAIHEMKATSDARRELNLFANLCELTPDDIQKMKMKDYVKLQKAFADFLS